MFTLAQGSPGQEPGSRSEDEETPDAVLRAGHATQHRLQESLETAVRKNTTELLPPLVFYHGLSLKVKPWFWRHPLVKEVNVPN